MITLRRVVPIAQTDIRNNLALILVALDDYSDGFEVRCLLQPGEGHHIRKLERYSQKLAR